jgi:lysophospholipase L1-like esterase/pimeloyl-ACP methyl ester carboxylesterase
MWSMFRLPVFVFGLMAAATGVAALAAASDTSAARTAVATPLRVACVGDSITFGSRTTVPEVDSYPAQLQRMLDPGKWTIRNFGVSGATLMNSGGKPYQKQAALADALAFKPDVVVIMLGTNDSKPDNWRHRADFVPDYHDLIAKFNALRPTPRLFICRPVSVIGEGNYSINGAAVAAELPLIDAVARDEGAAIIDMRAALSGHEAVLQDRVHPNTEGANLLARAAYRALTGNEFHGTLDPYLRSEWQGHERLDFECGGRLAFVVLPKTPAAGHPWIWRTEFFGVEPQTELALLERGWAAAYIDVRNLYGAPVALDAMDRFYAEATKRFGFAAKVVLAGFSRGGLFAFNWAARHPDRVAAIYADAPVLDFKSWPGGKGKGPGSPADWQRCLQAYGLTEAEALAYPMNPIDNLKPLAAARIPILSVCGDADHTVPFEENTKLAQVRYEALGGRMDVIVKPGGDHHPHSLQNPQPIVDFILGHVPSP